MKQLPALLLFVPSLCLAQVPDYVPADGLIGWYPLDGSLQSAINADQDGYLTGPVGSEDRFGAPQSALNFDGIDDYGTIDHYAAFENCSEMTISLWLNPTEHPSNVAYCGGGTGASALLINKWDVSNESRTFELGLSNWGIGSTGPVAEGYLYACNNAACWINTGTWTDFPIDTWTHVVYAIGADTSRVFVNGIASYEGIEGTAPDGMNFSTNPIRLGQKVGLTSQCQHALNGKLDDIGFWNRALTENEIQALFLANPLIYGCTDQDACNFQTEANADDGSCISCDVLASACGEGTVWDSTLAQCVSIAPPCAPSCGEGTIWDPVNEECIIAIPADLNYDGCVSVNDLLVLLAVHGTCPPYPEWPDEPTDTTWTCGDPLTYWDYDYATVLIGDQCWFAENLRTMEYTNGDLIPAALTNAEWISTFSGATAVYGEGSISCDNYSPEMNACEEAQSLAEYGRLYNWYAVDDARGLCPSGWHVPTDGEWTNLADYIASQGFTGTEGTALKSIYGWTEQFGGGNGTDDFGFSALPSGFRLYYSGFFTSAGFDGYWWSSSPNGSEAWVRRLVNDNPSIVPNSYPPRDGFSARCIKD